jgi:hypothetical protein
MICPKCKQERENYFIKSHVVMMGHTDNLVGEYESVMCYACHIKDWEDNRRAEIKSQLAVGYIRTEE